LRAFVNKLEILEVESPVIAPSEVFEASGHIDQFKEPMVEHLKCERRFRADHVLQESPKLRESEVEKLNLREVEEAIEKHGIRCPECGGTFGEPKYFLTIFNTTIGPYSGGCRLWSSGSGTRYLWKDAYMKWLGRNFPSASCRSVMP